MAAVADKEEAKAKAERLDQEHADNIAKLAKTELARKEEETLRIEAAVKGLRSCAWKISDVDYLRKSLAAIVYQPDRVFDEHVFQTRQSQLEAAFALYISLGWSKLSLGVGHQ